MQVMSLEVYTEDSNYAVIKPPGRNYPGCVIQGDSLRILCHLATNLARRVQVLRLTDEELLGEVEDLVGSLVGRMLHYQEIMQQHGIVFPNPVIEADLIRLLPDASE